MRVRGERSTMNSKARELQPCTAERFFSHYIGRDACLTSSCRSAIYLAIRALKLQGEIITSPLICDTALFPFLALGVKLCFADIDPATLNLDPEKVNEAISTRTAGILVSHLAGNPSDMKTITELTHDHRIRIIEDCAQGFNAEYDGKMVGTFGDLSCFSLWKPPTNCGGGLVCASTEEIESIKLLQRRLQRVPLWNRLISSWKRTRTLVIDSRRALHGLLRRTPMRLIRDPKYVIIRLSPYIFQPYASLEMEAGRKLQAAINGNLMDRYTSLGQQIHEKLESRGIRVQITTKKARRVFTRCIFLADRAGSQIVGELLERGVHAFQIAQGFQSRMDKHPYFKGFDSIRKCRNYLELHDWVVSLPVSFDMTRDRIDFIVNQICDLL